MHQGARHFADKLNNCLNETDAPQQIRERAAILSKLLDISKQEAWSLLEGHQVPTKDLVQRIAQEFEVDLKWLLSEK